MKNKRKTLKDSYKHYPYIYLPKHEYYVDYKLYRDICIDFNKLVFEKIINKGKEFIIPCNLGSLQILKIKTKGDIFNYELFHKTGKKIKQLNKHTFGYRVQYMWSKYRVHNNQLYKIVPTRFNKRTLSHILKTTMLIVTDVKDKIKNTIIK